MKIEYKASVSTPAGHRSVYVIASAVKLTDKRCQVTEVLTIDDEAPSKFMSRTGAKRQQFDGTYLANNEVSKTKNIGGLFKIHEA